MGTVFDNIPSAATPANIAIARAVVKVSVTIKERMQADYKKAFDLLWGSEGNYRSPQEVQGIIDVWGTNATGIFQASYLTQQFIASIDDEYVPLVPPYELTYNPDGSITVNEA